MDRWGRIGISLLWLGLVPGIGAFLTSQDTQVCEMEGFQIKPAVAQRYAEASDHFLVVFVVGSPDGELWGQRTDSEGQPVGDPFLIAEHPESRQPSIAHSSNSDVYLVVWSDKRAWETRWSDVYGQFISGAMNGGDFGGQLLGDHISLIDDLGSDTDIQRCPSVAFDTEHNQFLVVWHDDRDIGFEDAKWICGRRLSAATRSLVGDEIEITDATTSMQSPAVTYCPPDDSYLVVYSAVSYHRCDGQRVAHDGTLVGSPFEIGAGQQNAQRPAVSYAAGYNRCLVVAPLGLSVYGRLVSATRNGGDGGGQLIGSSVQLGPGSLTTNASVDFIPNLGLWFAAWDGVDVSYPLRGCWFDPDGFMLHGDCLLSHGSGIALSHGVGGRDTPWAFHSSGVAPFSTHRIFARRLPELLQGEDECVIERHDFLRVETDPAGWNIIGARPQTDFSVDLSIYPEVRLFSDDPLAESDYQGSGRTELIAVEAAATGAETLNLLVEVPQYDPTTLRMEHEVADTEITGYDQLHSSLDVEGNFLRVIDLSLTEGEHYVINAIPEEDDLDLNLALFEPGTVPISHYIGLDELVEIPIGEPRRYAYGMNPGRVETLYVVAPSTGTFGLAIWAGAGLGDYLLAVRPPDEPTTEELVKYLLGQSGIPWGGNVNGDMDGIWPIIDIADVVANMEAGR